MPVCALASSFISLDKDFLGGKQRTDIFLPCSCRLTPGLLWRSTVARALQPRKPNAEASRSPNTKVCCHQGSGDTSEDRRSHGGEQGPEGQGALTQHALPIREALSWQPRPGTGELLRANSAENSGTVRQEVACQAQNCDPPKAQGPAELTTSSPQDLLSLLCLTDKHDPLEGKWLRTQQSPCPREQPNHIHTASRQNSKR